LRGNLGLALTDYDKKAVEISASGLSVNSLALRSASVHWDGTSSDGKDNDGLAVSISEDRREDLDLERR
jgi:hypothetical protein